MTAQDSDGKRLEASKSYRINVPVNPPTKDFWSIIAYGNVSRTFIDSQKFTVSSNDEGTVVLHFLLRSKPRKLIFPALQLIKIRRRQNVRRMRLRHLWLLLLRILVIVLLVLALARPSLPAADYSLSLTVDAATPRKGRTRRAGA